MLAQGNALGFGNIPWRCALKGREDPASLQGERCACAKHPGRRPGLASSAPLARNLLCFLARTSGLGTEAGDILSAAGRPGDRWAGLREKAGREESPDTVVFAFFAGTKVLALCAGTKVFGGRRLRLKGNAPGNARGPTLRAVRASEARFPATDSATENKPPV